MVSTPPMKEQRRSQRIQHDLVVEMHDKRGSRRMHAVDVARHGLFLATEGEPPRERHLVQLTVHLPDGAIRAAASVTRRKKGQDGRDGVGVQFFALSDEAKQRWDDFILALQRTTTPPKGTPALPQQQAQPQAPAGATFLVKLKSVDRLREFASTHLASGGTVLFTPVLRGAGELVTLVVVHPATDEEFRLPGVVHRAHTERPKRLEIHFHGVTPALLQSFDAFVDTGKPPPTQLDLPVRPPLALPAANSDADARELELDVDVLEEVPPEPEPLPLYVGQLVPTVPAPPAPAEHPEIDLGLRPTTYTLRCSKCDAAPYAVDLGPCRGIMGLVADHSAFLSARTGRVVTSPRLVSPDERQERVLQLMALAMSASGELDASIDVATMLAAVSLAEPARDPETGVPLKQTRAVERLEHAARRLTDENATAQTKVVCASCREGRLVVERQR